MTTSSDHLVADFHLVEWPVNAGILICLQEMVNATVELANIVSLFY